MTIHEILQKHGFKPDHYFKVVNGEVYRNVAAGLIKEDRFKRATRRVGRYKLYAEHHATQLPYTNYFLIVDGNVYKREAIFSILEELVADLRDA